MNQLRKNIPTIQERHQEMANPNPSPKTRFPKGVSPNPGGKPSLPKELRNVKEFTVDELKRLIAKHFRMDKHQLARVLQDSDSPAINLIIASAIAKAIKEGDLHRAECLFMRSLGKVKEQVETLDIDRTQIIVTLPDNNRSSKEEI